MNFVVDHSDRYRVAIRDNWWIIIGWVDGDLAGVRPVVLNNQGRPEVVHAGRGIWADYRLERGPFEADV